MAKQMHRGSISLRWLIILIAIAIGGGLLVRRYSRPVVIVTEVVQAPVVQAFYSTGTIQPVREFPIKSNTAGTLVQVLVDKGDAIKKDQPLAIVDDSALRFTLEQAQAQLVEKQKRADPKTSPVLIEFDARDRGTAALLEIAQHEVKRMTDLMENNAGAQNDLDRAMERVKVLITDGESIRAQRDAKQLELNRELEVAQSAVSIAKWNCDQQTLRSPIDGVVLDRPTPLGTRVAINDPIMRVADVEPARLVMRADVDEEDIAQVNKEQTVRLTLYSFPGQVFTGKVAKIYDQADSSRRTFEVDVRLESPNDRLQPGMTGELAFVVQTRESTLVVPSQAVQAGSVYIVREGLLQKQPVTIGVKSIERTEILAGLSKGDRVVISPANSLALGEAVREQYTDPIAAAGLNKPPPITEAFKAFGH